jgi:KDO2-lipid IV(A) lauroyltransferase
MADERDAPSSAGKPPSSQQSQPPPTRPVLRVRYAVSRWLFAIGYVLLGFRRATIRDNLARSFPGADARTLRAMRRAFISRQSEVFAEIDYARQITGEELRMRVRLLNPEALADAQAPRPAIFAAAHQCNFEWLLLRASLELGEGLLALYKPLRNARAERYFHSVRTRFGTRLVPAKSVLRELARFREARGIGLVADQVPRSSPEKHWLEFLHQPTAFYMGPELLGRALRSTVYYVSMRRRARGQYEIEFIPLNIPGEKMPTGTITERYARALERDIQADPAGWWWSHRRWKLKKTGAESG